MSETLERLHSRRKMADMRVSESQRKKERAMEAPASGPRYPWGLELRLDKEALKKLGITELPEVGQKVSITGVGSVTSVSENKNKGSTSRSVEIQVEKLAVEKGK